MTAADAFALGWQCHRAGQWAQAESWYRQVLAQDPRHAAAYCNLGGVLAQQGRLDEALTSYDAALSVKPDYWEAHYNRGNALRRLGRLAQSAESYRSALRDQPGQPVVLLALGLADAELGNIDEAADLFGQAAQAHPDLAEARLHLAHARHLQGRTDDAVKVLSEWTRFRPQDHRAHLNAGLALLGMARREEGLAALREALRLRPDYPEAHNGLAIALSDIGDADQALFHAREAVRLRPDFAEALSNLGQFCLLEGRHDEALAALRGAVAARPDQAFLHSNLLVALNYVPDEDPAALFAEHRRWAQRFAERGGVAPRPEPNDPDPGRRLRIGYVSADFRGHTMAALTESVLAAHDRDRFHVTCYSNVTRPDAVTDRLRGRVEAWRNIVALADEVVAAQIREDRIDVLVDLSGHTAGNRLLVFARRPAPVQITQWGYPNTTGLAAMDYRLSDAHADPPELNDAFYSEAVCRLPETLLCYQPPASAPEVRDPPAVSAGFATFGSFNNAAKVNAQVVELWAQVLAAVPRSRLLMLRGQTRDVEARLRRDFEVCGISADRLRLVQRFPPDQYWQAYQEIDVCLDPFPYNGSVTSCDALWMGVPVITLVGRAARARQGLSLLANLGLTDLAAETPDGYVKAARRLAGDLDHLRRLRADMRDRMRASPLTDAPRFTRQLEDAYRWLWTSACAGLSAPGRGTEA